MVELNKSNYLECYMLINTIRKMLEIVVQWFQLNVDIIYSRRQPARICIKPSDEYQQFDAERRIRTLKLKR